MLYGNPPMTYVDVVSVDGAALLVPPEEGGRVAARGCAGQLGLTTLHQRVVRGHDLDTKRTTCEESEEGLRW